MNKQMNAEELKENVEKYASKTWISNFQKWNEQGFDMEFGYWGTWHTRKNVIILKKEDILIKIYFGSGEPEIRLELENPLKRTFSYYFKRYKLKQPSSNDVFYETFENYVIHRVDTIIQGLHNEEYLEKAKKWHAINEKMEEFKVTSLEDIEKMDTENLNNILQALKNEGF